MSNTQRINQRINTYIAWLNGTSVKAGTIPECEAHARRIFNTPAWQETTVGKKTVLRITTYGSQRLVSETVLSNDVSQHSEETLMTLSNQAPSKTLKHAISYLLDSYLHGSWPSDNPYVSSIQDASDILGETLNRHFPRQPVKAGRSKAAKARKSLTPDQLFFYEHAGYSYDPKTETAEQGRIRCAIELATAEAYAQTLGYEFEWDWDSYPDLSWMSDEEREQEHEVLCCRIPDPERPNHSLASLCGITDPDSSYRRVIEAELAEEAVAELDKEIETLDAH